MKIKEMLLRDEESSVGALMNCSSVDIEKVINENLDFWTGYFDAANDIYSNDKTLKYFAKESKKHHKFKVNLDIGKSELYKLVELLKERSISKDHFEGFVAKILMFIGSLDSERDGGSNDIDDSFYNIISEYITNPSPEFLRVCCNSSNVRVLKDGEYIFESIIKSWSQYLTPELCWTAIEKNACALQYVSNEIKTAALCRIPVSAYRHAMKFLPEQNKAFELCRIAILHYGYPLKYFPEELKTLELCKIAVAADSSALEYVPKAFKTRIAVTENHNDPSSLTKELESIIELVAGQMVRSYISMNSTL